MLSISTANRFETMYMTDLLQELINDGELIKPVIINNCWLEIDSVNDFQAAKKKFKDGSIMEFFDPEK
jgi:NDP-sugar pyrophosphorylase family protein